MVGIDIHALLKLVLATVSVFVASYAIGFLVRGQFMGSDSKGLLIFFAVIALAGGLLGAHPVPAAIAAHNLTKGAPN
jgi:hypothetical protein